MPAGLLSATITSEVKQEITLVLPPSMTVDKLAVNGMAQTVISQGVRKQGCPLTLPKGEPVLIEVKFHPATQ